MAQILKTYVVLCANTTIQTLDEQVIGISSIWIATSSSLAVGQGTVLVVTGAVSSLPTQFSFTGNVTTPCATLSLGYSPPATMPSLMIVKAVPAAGNVAGY